MNIFEEHKCDLQIHEEKEPEGSYEIESKMGPISYLDTCLHVTLNELNLGVDLQPMENEKKWEVRKEESVEYKCIMDIFTLSLWTTQVRAICVNSIKGSCPKLVTI